MHTPTIDTTVYQARHKGGEFAPQRPRSITGREGLHIVLENKPMTVEAVLALANGWFEFEGQS
jgi:hypothetical protein